MQRRCEIFDLFHSVTLANVQSFTLNDYQEDLGIGKGSGNWTKLHLAQEDVNVMEAVTWQEWLKYLIFKDAYKNISEHMIYLNRWPDLIGLVTQLFPFPYAMIIS